MSLACGIDVGASATKAAVVDGEGALLGGAVLRTGINFAQSAEKALGSALDEAGRTMDEVGPVIACGYGRNNVELAGGVRTEIACHAAGAYYHFPRALTVVDIGGQDNKVIRLDDKGRRISFKMNRKCAAGTGAFLEEMALRLNVPLEDFDGLARASGSQVTLGAYCTVFTATEVLAKIREGVALEDLIKGLFKSVIMRVREMEAFSGDVVMTGGVVAHNPYLVEMMAAELDQEVLTPPKPQLTGAWGAALLALREG